METQTTTHPLAGAAILAAPLMLAACGAGTNDPDQPAARSAGAMADNGQRTTTAASTAQVITDAAASRFLAQASMGASREQIARVKTLGYVGWLDEQFALPLSQSRWDALMASGFGTAANRYLQSGFDACAWRKLITAPDTLRQRVVLALSEILVVGIDGLTGPWRQFGSAAWLDMLEANAFGNYRTLLQGVSLSTAMGEFLSFRGNMKANPTLGSLPDENYARELMQLFTIGLVQLNLDGSPKLANGQPQETYGLADITGLARVFTGWDYDLAGGTTMTPDYRRRPMAAIDKRHETGAKTFLGTTIPAGGSAASDMKAALDTLFAHPNMAPFVGRQLIQRLVTSNPSPAYVARVAAVFNNDGRGVKGNLQAVIKAILLDDEARSPSVAAGAGAGKQREPILRFTAWARAFKVTSTNNAWDIGNTSNPTVRLGQSPLRSPSVFNFFRPGYVPPGSAIANAGLVAPEFQLTNEMTTIGYINFMENMVVRGFADIKPDYSTLLPLADNGALLLAELNTVLAAGQLSDATLALLTPALNSMPYGTEAKRLNRIYAAQVLVLAAPEFIIQH